MAGQGWDVLIALGNDLDHWSKQKLLILDQLSPHQKPLPFASHNSYWLPSIPSVGNEKLFRMKH